MFIRHEWKYRRKRTLCSHSTLTQSALTHTTIDHRKLIVYRRRECVVFCTWRNTTIYKMESRSYLRWFGFDSEAAGRLASVITQFVTINKPGEHTLTSFKCDFDLLMFRIVAKVVRRVFTVRTSHTRHTCDVNYSQKRYRCFIEKLLSVWKQQANIVSTSFSSSPLLLLLTISLLIQQSHTTVCLCAFFVVVVHYFFFGRSHCSVLVGLFFRIYFWWNCDILFLNHGVGPLRALIYFRVCVRAQCVYEQFYTFGKNEKKKHKRRK